MQSGERTAERQRWLAWAQALAMLCVLSAPTGVVAQTIAPTVDYPGTLYIPPAYIEERGLDEPAPPIADVSALNVAEALNIANERNAVWVASCTTPGPWTVNGTTVSANGSDSFTNNQCVIGNPGTLNNWYAFSSSETRVIVTVVGTLIDNTSGTPGSVSLRGVIPGLPEFRVEGASLEGARRDLLLFTQSATGRRYFSRTPVLTGGGPLVTTDRMLSSVLTGRDTTYIMMEVIGPSFAVVGTRNNCPSAVSTVGCSGGVRTDVQSNSVLFVAHTMQTLYITNTVERTLTGGVEFYDVEMTPLPSGAAHAAFANAGFLITDRFLRRLTDGPADPAAERGAIWSEAWGSQTRFDGAADTGSTDIDSFGFAGGFVVRPSERWSLGVAGEYGESDLSIADALTPEAGEASHLKMGAHASFGLGRFRANIAAMLGVFDIETAGHSALGDASADYDATISGASLEAGYDVPVGALTLTPNVGVSVLSWERDGFSEAGGPAPLALAAADESQTRVWAGINARWTPHVSEGRLAVSAYARAVSISGDTRAHVTTFDPQLPGEPIVVAGPDFADHSAEFGAALDYRLSERSRIEAAYDGRASDSFDEHTGRVTLRIAF